MNTVVVDSDALTVKAAARMAGVHPKTVYRAVQSGKLGHFRKYGPQQGIRVWPKDVNRWIRKG